MTESWTNLEAKNHQAYLDMLQEQTARDLNVGTVMSNLLICNDSENSIDKFIGDGVLAKKIENDGQLIAVFRARFETYVDREPFYDQTMTDKLARWRDWRRHESTSLKRDATTIRLASFATAGVVTERKRIQIFDSIVPEINEGFPDANELTLVIDERDKYARRRLEQSDYPFRIGKKPADVQLGNTRTTRYRTVLSISHKALEGTRQ